MCVLGGGGGVITFQILNIAFYKCFEIEKPCVNSRGHSFDTKFMKLCQNVNLN